MSPETQPESATTQPALVKVPGIVKTARFLAWFILITSAIGATILFSQIGLSTNFSDISPTYSPHASMSINTYGVAVSIATLISGIIGAVLSLLAFNAENIYYVRCDIYYKNGGE